MKRTMHMAQRCPAAKEVSVAQRKNCIWTSHFQKDRRGLVRAVCACVQGKPLARAP